MDVQRAERLVKEAGDLTERLAGLWCDAVVDGRYFKADRIMVLRQAAERRWDRRLDKWAIAAYGPGVHP